MKCIFLITSRGRMNANDWKFPMDCPACKSVAGNPYGARTEPEELVIKLRCGDCRHEWTMSAPAPLIFRRHGVGQSEPVD